MNIKTEKTANLKLAVVASFSLLAASAFPFGFIQLPAFGQSTVPSSDCELTTQQAKLAPAESAGTTGGVDKTTAAPVAAKTKKLTGPLKGVVSETEFVTVSIPDPHLRIEGLVKLAVERDEQTELMNARAKKYGNVFKQALVKTSDMVQFVTAYKGFESSSEAADVVLDEKVKLKSDSAVRYARQRQYDEKHTKITLSMLHIAQALGSTGDDARKAKTIAYGCEQLKQLLGEELANTTVRDLIAWSKTVQVDESVYSRPNWDVLEIDQKAKSIVDSSMASDTVVAEIKSELHKYNHKSKLSRFTSKFVNTTLSIAMFSPTIISPAAQIAMFAYVACTGGPEEAKLLNELYLDRRFESRWKSVNAEANMSVHNYNTAVMTRNPVLLRFSEALMTKMAGAESIAQLTQPDSVAAETKVSAETSQHAHDTDKLAVEEKLPAENKAISSTGDRVH